MRILVTGGLGFIGSNFIRRVLETTHHSVLNLDACTYAGNPANLSDLERNPRYAFLKGDVSDPGAAREAVKKTGAIVHFAAETHVDRSLLDAAAFLRTNVIGTQTLLEAARLASPRPRFLHLSTDEVYGDVPRGRSKESDAMCPTSPYSASKAAAEHLVMAYRRSYGMDVVIARPSNNFGPYQHPEKAVPLMLTHWLDGLPYPLYGDGRQKRCWIYVKDCVEALALLLEKGEPGRAYNIGGRNLTENGRLVHLVAAAMGLKDPMKLVRKVQDRPGHDRRYAIDSSRLAQLGFPGETPFGGALRETAAWYRDRRDWWEPLKKSAGFSSYYEKQYQKRLERATA